MHGPHLEEAITYKKNVYKMVALNFSLYILSHVPDFCITILMISFKHKLLHFCIEYFSCTELIEMMQTFNFFIICFQFFILNHFDHNIQTSFAELRQNFFKK